MSPRTREHGGHTAGPTDLDNLIALGTVTVYRDVANKEIPELHPDDPWDEFSSSLSTNVALQSAQVVDSIRHLVSASWLRVFRPSAPSDSERWRVYVLPHDIGRGHIDRRNKALQKMMHIVLSSISTSTIDWDNLSSKPDQMQGFDLWASREDCSLFYLFNTLPSPSPNPDAVSNTYMRSCLHRVLDKEEDPWGLKTKLYPYQRRAVASMLQKELAPSMQLDPRFEERTSMTGKTFYYNARDSLFLKSPRYYDTVRGGILAETMGLGKTLLCLATVLATRGQYPEIPAVYAQQKTFPHVPSLAEAAAFAATKAGTPWKTYFEQLQEETGYQHDECMKIMNAQRPSYELPPREVRTMRKSSIYGAPETVKLCTGTIIVVPPNLVQQWEGELVKHTRENTLKVLVLKERKSLIPPSDELLQYDLVLFSRSRFEREVSATDELYVSPLKDLHWLRIIIDEGQGFSSNSTNAAAVAETVVRAERRWIVSGTPSKDLLGVEVSLPAMQLSDVEQASHAYRTESLEKRRQYDAQLERASGAAKSLGALASRFLRVQPWANSLDDSEATAVWDEYIYRHEDFRQRTYTSFSRCFRTTLSSMVIKTRPDDVERDLLLPPLKHQVVRLQPSAMDKMTANLFVLLYTTNAITSERRDQDYLFHSNSRFHLLRLTQNLRQSAFFWVGFGEDSIQASLDVSERYLNKPDRDCSESDRKLLLDTMESTRCVLRSPVWNALSTTQEMGVFLNAWPEEAKEAWLFRDCLDPPAMGLTQVGHAQRYVNKQLASEDPLDGLSSAAHPAGEQSVLEIFSDVGADQRPLEMVKNGVPSATLGDNFRPNQHRSTKKNKTTPSKQPKGTLSHGDISPTKPAATKRKVVAESKNINIPADSPLGSISVLGTASSKLSYLMDRVLDLQSEEKILIFYDGGHIAYYISQMLDLLNVKHLIYANTLSSDARSKYIVLFDTDATYRVLVMDIKQAARGLNVSSASRVFFVNPPCQPDIEAQAVKRAHRIGQTRPVHVETLVLAGTVEEAIHDRAAKMTQREHSSTKTLEDDEDIRSIIQNARVLPLAEEESHGLSQMASLAKPQQVFGRPGRVAGAAEGLEKEIFGEIGEGLAARPRKKPRTNTPIKKKKGDAVVSSRTPPGDAVSVLQSDDAIISRSIFGGV